MKQEPYVVDDRRRESSAEAIRKSCAVSRLATLASNLRSNHVQLVVQAFVRPERMLDDFK